MLCAGLELKVGVCEGQAGLASSKDTILPCHSDEGGMTKRVWPFRKILFSPAGRGMHHCLPDEQIS